MRYTIVTLLFIALLTGCGTTGIVKLEQNHFMVSTKSAKIGFVNAAEEKADVYAQANEYCAKFGKEVKPSILRCVILDSQDQRALHSNFAVYRNKNDGA